MKESKKAILKSLEKQNNKKSKFDLRVLNLALQKVDSDSFDFDGEAVYTDDRKCIIYCLSHRDSFTIPDGVETIGEKAFVRKKGLKNVIIPSTVKTIDEDAFFDCDTLDNVFIPASVETVRNSAFAECDNLKSVTFGGVPKHLSRHTFDDDDSFHTIVVPAKSAKTFKKFLHYSEEDDYLIVEKKEKKTENK